MEEFFEEYLIDFFYWGNEIDKMLGYEGVSVSGIWKENERWIKFWKC